MIVNEVKETVALIAEIIENTRTILSALEDGQAYLKKNHPDAKNDLADMMKQMKATVAGLISITRVVTYFDFTSDGTDMNREPARFNEHLLAARNQVADLESDIQSLKGSCSRIQELSLKLEKRAGNRPWWALLGDRAGQRADELSWRLSSLYFNDLDMAQTAKRTLHACEQALDAVRQELRRGGAVSTSNVPRAQNLLDEYAAEFRTAETGLRDLRDRLSDQIGALS